MDRKKLGELLKSLRGARFTQKTLAEAAGVSYGVVQDLESGDGNPQLDKIESVEGALGTPLLQLYSGPKIHPPLDPTPSLAFVSAFLLNFEGLLPEHRAFVATLVFQDTSYLADDPALFQVAEKLLKSLPLKK